MIDLAAGSTPVNIKPLLQRLRPGLPSTAFPQSQEIALAVSHIFTNQLSPAQTAVLLDRLALTGLDQQPDVLARCAVVMREAAEHVDITSLKRPGGYKTGKTGTYEGGLCDIVGTGGDGHSTFNISTASSILASSLLYIAKHGNRASTSKSGSAEVLASMKIPRSPKLENVTAKSLIELYKHTRYSFLFAPTFHKALKNVTSIRRELPGPSIFNLLGPLTNPVGPAIEASLIGVKAQSLVPVFAEALKISGTRKAMVVCGREDLDEISCAGPTLCARLVNRASSTSDGVVDVEKFILEPSNFGLTLHPLSTVSPGLTPDENAAILGEILSDRVAEDDAILHFILMNTAALFVVSGACDTDVCPFDSGAQVITETGPGGCRWKEGVRLARLAIQSGKALQMLKSFAEFTNELES